MVSAEYGVKLAMMKWGWRLCCCWKCHQFWLLWCAREAWRSLSAAALIRGGWFFVTLCCIHLSAGKEPNPFIWTNQFSLFSDISAHGRFTSPIRQHWCLTASKYQKNNVFLYCLGNSGVNHTLAWSWKKHCSFLQSQTISSLWVKKEKPA